MKKILSLMLILLCVVSMVACGGSGSGSGTGTPTPPSPNPPAEETLDVFAAAKKDAVPTKIVSLTTYTGKDFADKSFTFSGSFTQVANGNNSIFDFNYQRFATIDEAADDYIVTVKGAIAIQNGRTKTIGDSYGGGDWEAVIPAAGQMSAFKLDQSKLPAGYKLSTDGMKLTVSLTKEQALSVIGAVIDAAGDITLTVESNGKNLSGITVEYTATSGASVRVATSYTYGVQTLDFSRFN